MRGKQGMQILPAESVQAILIHTKSFESNFSEGQEKTKVQLKSEIYLKKYSFTLFLCISYAFEF